MKKIIISVCMLFAISASAHAVKVYPNPWIPESKSGSQGTINDGIKFTGLSNSGGAIRIYNATGELVRKLPWSLGETEKKWDGKNDRSEYVGSGVYIWVIKDGGTRSGKIVVIR